MMDDKEEELKDLYFILKPYNDFMVNEFISIDDLINNSISRYSPTLLVFQFRMKDIDIFVNFLSEIVCFYRIYGYKMSSFTIGGSDELFSVIVKIKV